MIIGGLASAFGSYQQGKSADKASAANAAASETNVWGPQQPYLGDIYSQARGQFGAGQAAQPGAAQWFGNIGQQGGQAFQNLAMGPQNPYLQGMASRAMGQVSDQFAGQVMPALIGGANAAGQLGGERFGLLQAQAAKAAAGGMADAGADVYGRAWDSGMQGQLGALSAMPGMANFGMSSLDQPWQNLSRYADVVGNPVLGNGSKFGGGGINGFYGAGGAGAGNPGGMPALWGGSDGQRGWAEHAQNAPFNGVTGGDAAMTGFQGNLGGSLQGALGGLGFGSWW